MPVIAADNLVVHIDVVVRFDPRPPDTHPVTPGYTYEARWRSDDDAVVRAVALTMLRLRAQELNSADLMTDRAGVADLLERALQFAPGPSWYDVRTVRVEMSRDRPTEDTDIRVRVLDHAGRPD